MNVKRLFDLLFSTLGLLVLSPLFLIISLCVFFDAGRPIIFKQKRVGKDYSFFILYKFRSMDAHRLDDGPACSNRDDKRVTKTGKYLRKYKLDEIPQLFNVLKGDMSLVGPRPEVEKFVNYYSNIFKEILTIKPGLTDLASIKFRNESFLLLDNKSIDIEKHYLAQILPKKLEYNKEYLERHGFFYDIGLIFKTIYTVIFKSKPE